MDSRSQTDDSKDNTGEFDDEPKTVRIPVETVEQLFAAKMAEFVTEEV